MMKVFTDFNARTSNGACWILKYDGSDLGEKIDELGLAKGDKVKLFQDENDFEVIAVLDYKYVDLLQREVWVAVPDWSTIARK
jgi:hypothetical protein